MWSCSVRKIIEEHIKKEAQEWDCDNAVAHELSGAECIRLQQNYLFNLHLSGVKRDKMVGHFAEINLPQCFSSVADEGEDGFLLSLFLLLSMQHLIVSSLLRAFRFQGYGCQECYCCLWLYLSLLP